MCRNPALWPQGQSFCRDQSKSLRLSPTSTYWHIQMPSVYCENRSISWNNTATDNNVPVCDYLWSSFGFTDSGAFMRFPQQLQSALLCRKPFPPHAPKTALVFSFFASGFPAASRLHHSHPNNLNPTYFSWLPFFPYKPPPACVAHHSWLSVSSGQLWAFLIYYPKQKWHGISAGWLG